MTHTPGPWHWEADPVKGDPYGRVRYQVCALGKTVTRVYYSSFEGGPTNAEADARLIAAAPKMLEALHRAREKISILMTRAGFVDTGIALQLAEIDAAIAEAEGRT